MSAAATAAGYLYASGRLRGKASREAGELEQQPKGADKPKRRPLRVAVYDPRPAYEPAREKPAVKRVPKIEYRTRRWRPE